MAVGIQAQAATDIPAAATDSTDCTNSTVPQGSLSNNTVEQKKPADFVCKKNSYSRGVGQIHKKCPDGWSRIAGLCYRDCEPDYFASTLTFCQLKCQDPYPVNCGAAFCAKSKNDCAATVGSSVLAGAFAATAGAVGATAVGLASAGAISAAAGAAGATTAGGLGAGVTGAVTGGPSSHLIFGRKCPWGRGFT